MITIIILITIITTTLCYNGQLRVLRARVEVDAEDGVVVPRRGLQGRPIYIYIYI